MRRRLWLPSAPLTTPATEDVLVEVAGCPREAVTIAFDDYARRFGRYHKLLWSKPLPNGVMFDLDDTPDVVPPA